MEYLSELRDKAAEGIRKCRRNECGTCRYRDETCLDGGEMIAGAPLRDALKVLEAMEPTGRRARLMTAEDFEDNPDVDGHGYLPCWVECNERERQRGVSLGVIEPGESLDGWSEASLSSMPGGQDYNPDTRLWTWKPTQEQREVTPWPSI